MTHIYRIQDDEGSIHEGRDEVPSVLVKYYAHMLGKQIGARTKSLSSVVYAGPVMLRVSHYTSSKQMEHSAFSREDIRKAIFFQLTTANHLGQMDIVVASSKQVGT